VRPDCLVVAAYGLILPPWVLALPRLGCVNIHASLLPRWRGAAPIQRAIEAGDTRTGITIMQMDAGLDTGPALMQEALAIAPDETAGTLHDKLVPLGGRMIVRALRGLAAGELTATPQPDEGVTYAAKVDKSQARIDWREPAEQIERRVRAFDPVPGSSFVWRGEPLKLWRSRVVAADLAAAAAPGTPVDLGPGRLAIGCGTGVLELLEVQRAGGRRVAVAQYLQAIQGRRGARR
jgi:methionyl-tRNA formyltransferase